MKIFLTAGIALAIQLAAQAAPGITYRDLGHGVYQKTTTTVVAGNRYCHKTEQFVKDSRGKNRRIDQFTSVTYEPIKPAK